MACVRKRRGRFVLDYRDHLGVRRWRAFPTLAQANEELAAVLREAGKERSAPQVHRNITFADYAKHWLEIIRPSVEESTWVGMEAHVRLHLVPSLGTLVVRKLRRAAIRNLLSAKMSAGLSRDSVRLILATLRSMLTSALRDDELIRENPAQDMSRTLRLSKHVGKQDKGDTIKAFDRDQLALFLATAAERDAPIYPLLFTMARAGLRMGEALALRWPAVDLDARVIRITEAKSRKRVKAPKSKAGKRSVDMSPQLVTLLRPLSLAATSEYVFASEAGSMLDASNIGKRFGRIVRLAKLKGFSPHSLRHAFASQLLAEGESPAYVQEQLGHSSIKLTVDTYGRWLRKKPLVGVAALDSDASANTGSFCLESVAAGQAAQPSDSSYGTESAPVEVVVPARLERATLRFEVSSCGSSEGIVQPSEQQSKRVSDTPESPDSGSSLDGGSSAVAEPDPSDRVSK